MILVIVGEKSMVYVFCGLVFGSFIPYISRRFAKFMPATFGYALFRIFTPGKAVARRKKTDLRYKNLRRAFFMRSLVWGAGTALLSFAAITFFAPGTAGWSLYFIWSLLLLSEIDMRMELLPDILTVPLLIIGFCFAVFNGSWAGIGESAVGAVGGYFIPALASLTLIWKNKDVFGGGDIKLLAGIGAWLGLENMLYVIIVSSILFLIYALVNRQRQGAFGPSIAAAAIIVAFFTFGY